MGLIPPYTGPFSPNLPSNPLSGLALAALAQDRNRLLQALTPSPPIYAPPSQWIYVRGRFRQFQANLGVGMDRIDDAQTKQAGIRACLNRHYWGVSSDTANSTLIGSCAKHTLSGSMRDIDILFLLPPSVFHRYQRREGNRQSALLQEVKGVLEASYPQTRMKGDGQVVSVPFNSIPVEVSIGFRCLDGSIIVCDANDGGKYTTSTAAAELAELSASDNAWNGNARMLVRMVKCWQEEKNVLLKSCAIERAVIQFLRQWPYAHHDIFWHDWMVRDFFAFLTGYANGWAIMPGTGERILLGDEWLHKAITAHRHAINACENERENYGTLAGGDWQEIFGSSIPVLA